MSRKISLKCCVVIFGMVGFTGSTSAQTGDQIESFKNVLLDATGLRFNEAFTRLEASPPDDQTRKDFARAMLLLNVQPKTTPNVDEARAILRRLAALPDEDTSIQAHYFLGRIAQLHQYEPDWLRAASEYELIIKLRPEHPYAQLAAVKLALVLLYSPATKEVLQARFERLRLLNGNIIERSCRRDFNYVMAQACMTHGFSPKAALEHLLIVADVGVIQSRTRASTFVRIAELAGETGQPSLAMKYYSLFLEEFPRDVRAVLIQQRLAALSTAR